MTDSLNGARAKLPDLRLEPLAGQRLNSLEKLAQTDNATDAQRAALVKAIALWRRHDEKRPFFSHGVFAELLDRNEQWHVQIDFVTVQKGVCKPRRMNLSKAEAEEFEKGLQEAFKALSGQLGQLRKRLAS